MYTVGEGRGSPPSSVKPQCSEVWNDFPQQLSDHGDNYTCLSEVPGSGFYRELPDVLEVPITS